MGMGLVSGRLRLRLKYPWGGSVTAWHQHNQLPNTRTSHVRGMVKHPFFRYDWLDVVRLCGHK